MFDLIDESLIFPVWICNNFTVQNDITLIVGNKTVNRFKTIYLRQQQHSERRKRGDTTERSEGQSSSHVTQQCHIYITVGFLRSHPVKQVQDDINNILIQK